MFSIFPLNRTFILTIAGLAVLVGLIAFTEHRQNHRQCEGIDIRMDEVDGHRFLNRNDVLRTLTNDGADPLLGDSYADLNLKRLEERLKRNGLIKSCQVFRDLKGVLIADIQQQRPLARLVPDGTETKSAYAGYYLTDDGRWFPLSMNYTARVVLVSGPYFSERKSLTTETNQPLLKLLRQIEADPFWKAQVAQVIVDRNREVTLIPQVGDCLIEIGQPVELEAKFEKIKLFYKHILPLKGWDRYRRVSVQYRNQIVCE
ncbi:cell division protein FtsQ/DivIB [Larkinella sp. VNQ87]|uniref:cell division protein FtsQ/DivIB n=1 Tax=Larkinella sp. VNQ87 TaxID=3400921 RepID=UPI003BFB239E